MTNTMSVQYILYLIYVCHWHSSESYQVGIQSVWYGIETTYHKLALWFEF